MPRVPASREKLTGERLVESSPIVAARVEAAQERQRKRFASHDSRVVCNADMTPADMRVPEACKLDATRQSLMRSTTRSEQLQLSVRAFHRARSVTLCVGRTIVDLAASDDIAPVHLAEAIHFRQAEEARVNASN